VVRIRLWLSIPLILVGLGCRTDSSLHVWTPPVLQSAVGQQILVAPLAGDKNLAKQVHAAMLSAQPSDPGRQLAVRTADELETQAQGSVMLASAIESSEQATISDLTLLALARQAGTEWLLMGEVLPLHTVRHSTSTSIEERAEDRGEPEPIRLSESADDSRLTVVWRLYDVATARPVADRALVVDAKVLAERYPDLVMIDAEPVDRLAVAAGREAWTLITPAVERVTIELAKPWILPGSAAVRKANAEAQAGRWPAAMRAWQAILAEHPRQHAAAHNLAIAAVAAQDFATARQLIAQALQKRDSAFYRRSSAWIETKQRAYHRAFELPDPPEGWAITHR